MTDSPSDDAHRQREVALTREVLEAKIETLRNEITTRLDGMDAALKLTEEFPTEIQKAAGHLRELYDEKLRAMDRLLEAQRAAEKEARDKAEASVAAQLRQLEQTHESRNETLRTSLAAVKERLTRIDGQSAGASSAWGWVIGIIGMIAVILTALVSVPW